MNELKKPLSIDEQVQMLKNHKMIVEDFDFAKSVLAEVSYYRFSGYALHRRISSNDSDFISGTSFMNIYNVYQFDASLRDLLRKYKMIAYSPT